MNELPESLRRYEEELRRAVARDRRRATGRRRARRVGVAAIVAAAAALGVLTALPAGGGSLVDRAAAALREDSGTILHFEVVGRRVTADGTTVGWRQERWQAGKRADARQVEWTSSGAPVESAVADGVPQLYDPATDTILVGRSKAEILPEVGQDGRQVKEGDDAAARKLRDALAKKASALGMPVDKTQVTAGKPEPTPAASDAAPADDPFRAKILTLLKAGKAREDGHVAVGGRDAVRISLDGGRATYLVDAETYAPIEYAATDGGGSVTLRFPVYERLPRTPANLALLSLRAQHPNARVDADASHYAAARARLLPAGR